MFLICRVELSFLNEKSCNRKLNIYSKQISICCTTTEMKPHGNHRHARLPTTKYYRSQIIPEKLANLFHAGIMHHPYDIEFTYSAHWCGRVSKGKLICSCIHDCLHSSIWKSDCGYKEQDSLDSNYVSFNAYYPIIGYLAGIPHEVITHPRNNCVPNYSYCSSALMFAQARRTALAF